MTDDEVSRMLDVFEKADGGCSYCCAELLDVFAETFPELAGHDLITSAKLEADARVDRLRKALRRRNEVS